MSSHFYNDQIPQGWEAAIIGVCIETITPPSKINTIEYSKSGKFPIIDQSQDFICGWTDDEKKVIKISEPVIIFGDHTCVTKFVNFDFAQGADGIKILKSKKFLNPKFLYQLLQFDPIVPEMYKRHFSKLKGKKILYPKDKAEQKMISQVLGDMDELISVKCELLDKKRAIKQAAAQQLLTPKPHWHTATLGEILQYEQPTNYIIQDIKILEKGSVPVLTAGKSFILGYTEEEFNCYENFPVIIFDDFTTDSKFVNFRFKVKSSAMKMLKPKNDKISIKFAFMLLQNINFFVGDHKRHWISEFSKFEISFPDITEQTKIAQILSDMDDEILALQDEIEKLKMIKQGAMDELLSGKIRLKG
ncbi:restriction endonuclease subunit S [Campylobacter concisus]|uniref:restriction endonuclease subunit S n=1 Tax=Campylobacter concisus TaxID=199 RepID=UPI0021CC6C2C|nr:restriction endonuclease subunit S [Campylobacter concisus]